MIIWVCSTLRESIMAIKKKDLWIIIILLINSKLALAVDQIPVERYENWGHPILAIFKKYNFTVQKVNYLTDKTCPIFYGKFRYDPATGALNSELDEIYYKALKANSYFPYVLIDKSRDLRINVGWKDKQKTQLVVNMYKAAYQSKCRYGGEDYINEKFVVDSEMKKRIMQSPFKVSFKRQDGKELIAYLYADDEEIELADYSSFASKNKEILETKMGHYYIYLYDVKSDSFFPNRTSTSEGSNLTMDTNGLNFLVLPDSSNNQANVFLVNEQSSCAGKNYAAYALEGNESYLKRYYFVGKNKDEWFFGHIERSKKHNKISAYGSYEGTKLQKIYLHLSDVPGEIKLVLPKTSNVNLVKIKKC